MPSQPSPDFIRILNQFQVIGKFQDALPYGEGHINDTYLVRFEDSQRRQSNYILQRINHKVFQNPEAVMANMVRVTSHIHQRVLAMGGDPFRKTITLIPTVVGGTLYRDSLGNCWRLAHFIQGARTYLRAQHPQHYYTVAFAFGEFLALLDDFPVSEIVETIPDFHHTPKRYRALIRAVENDPLNRARTIASEISFITRRESATAVLMDLLEAGKLPKRVTHNDTKIDNVMMDDRTGEGLCVIDLDTVMPGLSVFDFGDVVRSGANLAAEDEPDPSKVRFSPGIFDCLAQGFMDAARGILTRLEVDSLAFGARMITLEQGIRFLTDYLNGDIYYKIRSPHHNLHRARTQLKLVADMEECQQEMETAVNKYRG
jgi:hypothetical protein